MDIKKEKIIKIILYILIVLLYLPSVLMSIFTPFVTFILPLLFSIFLIVFNIIIIKNNLFEKSKRVRKLILYFAISVINAFSFIYIVMISIANYEENKNINEVSINHILDSITYFWIYLFLTFITFNFFLGIVLFIDNIIRNNRPLKWYNWVILILISITFLIILFKVLKFI